MPHCNKRMLSFFLTTKCNLCCVYCYNAKERAALEEKTLSLHIAKEGIDYFFQNFKSRHIRFYGPGEPTQEFGLMKDIVEYARKKADKPIKTEIQTNGVFGKEVREWILKNINILWMSFDGPPDIQNFNRPINRKNKEFNKLSSEVIEENVKWLIENSEKEDLMVGARVTISEKNNHRQLEMIDYFEKLGINQIWTDPVFQSVDKIPVCNDKRKIENYYFDYDKYVDNYVKAYKYAKEKGVFYGSILTCNFDGDASFHCRACTPVPHLTPDGYISACDMVVLGEEAYHMDCFIYGKWDEKQERFIFDEEKINDLRNRNVYNISHCKNCDINLYCGGYCLGEIVNETGDLYGQNSVICKAIHKIFYEIGPYENIEFLHP